VEPKSESGRRIVPLIGPAGIALRAQRSRVAELRRRAGPAWQDHDLVFPSEIGTPTHPMNVNREFKKLLARAGLPTSHRVHNLRHSTATYLLAAGVDGRIVMQIMGWSQITMLSRCQHVLDRMLEDTATRLEAVFPRMAQAG
jgi:integrase